jgi:hypothetical protein
VTRFGSLATDAGSTVIATSRFSRESRARYAHATGAEDAADLERTDAGAWGKRHGYHVGGL